MQVNANILNVQITTKSNGKGGSYKVAELDYKDLDQNKAQSRKVMSFGPSEKAFLALAQGLTGNVIITLEKVGDYWNIVAIEKPANNAGPQPAPAAAAPQQASYAPQARVSDEDRQKLIVRQSSLDRAIQFLSLKGDKKATTDDVVEVAERFVDFVYDQYTPDLGGVKATTADNMSDDIPF